MTRRMFGKLIATLVAAFGLTTTATAEPQPDPLHLTCPQCGRQAHVVCSNRQCSCWRHVPDGELPLRWTPDGECEQCPYCGFTAHADYWFDRDLDLMARRDEAARTDEQATSV